MKVPERISTRAHEITVDFLKEVDKHLLDIVEERATEMFEVRDFAEILHIHPRHLTDTIKSLTGNSPCYYFEGKILKIAKEMLEKNELSIKAIAISLTYDPSNFTKFFKRFTGKTPKQYREEFLAENFTKETVRYTI